MGRLGPGGGVFFVPVDGFFVPVDFPEGLLLPPPQCEKKGYPEGVFPTIKCITQEGSGTDRYRAPIFVIVTMDIGTGAISVADTYVQRDYAGGSSSPGHSAAAVQRGFWGPPIHNMGLCGRPGKDPNTWKQFGPETTGQ